jgi:hypothetical protein
MADSFDIVDIVYTAVAAAVSGFTIDKDNSKTGQEGNHIVINTTGTNSKDYVNKAPAVNINVFIPEYDNGKTNRQLMKTTVRLIENAVRENLSPPAGMYLDTKIAWTIPLYEAKDGFDCINIKLEVITELN